MLFVPTSNPGQSPNGGGADAFVTKLANPANTLTVTDANDSGPGSLREALALTGGNNQPDTKERLHLRRRHSPPTVVRRGAA